MREATSIHYGDRESQDHNWAEAKHHAKYRALEKSHNTSNHSPPDVPIQQAKRWKRAAKQGLSEQENGT